MREIALTFWVWLFWVVIILFVSWELLMVVTVLPLVIRDWWVKRKYRND